MKRAFIALVAAFALLAQPAAGDIIRHATIPSVLLGTWAEATEQCATKDKSNVLIESTRYGDGSGSCVVRWVVETAGSRGSPMLPLSEGRYDYGCGIQSVDRRIFEMGKRSYDARGARRTHQIC
jgi:hypothetical protein